MSRSKSINYKGAHENFAGDPVQFTLRYTSEKNKFIVYIYINFNQDLDDKSYSSARIKAVNQLYNISSANCGTMPTSNQIVESNDLFWHH